MERTIYELTIDQWVELREFIRKGTEPFNTSADVALVMDEFAQKFDIVAMYDYYVWAMKNGDDSGKIIATLTHDLAQRNTRCFSPRTESYRGINEEE
jgi:hypothetical protein